MKVELSDLKKIFEVLNRNERFHRYRDMMNAELHLSSDVIYSPLTSATIKARERLWRIVESEEKQE